MKKQLVIFCMMVTLTLPADQTTLEMPVLRIPAITEKPQIDGRMHEPEWRSAAQIFAMMKAGTASLTSRQGEFYLGFDEANLYLAFRSELPPQGMKLLSRVETPGTLVPLDDAVEILLHPPNSPFVYQSVVNFKGTRLDLKYPVVFGGVTHTDYVPWTCTLLTASREHEGCWELEMQIPLKELGGASTDSVLPWKMQLVRSWKQPDEQAAFSKAVYFCNPSEMGSFYLDRNAPAIHFNGLGKNYQKGEYDICFSVINNTTTSKNIQYSLDVQSIAAPRERNGVCHIPAGETRDFSLQYSEAGDFPRELRVCLIDKDSAHALYQRHFSWEKHSSGSGWVNPQQKQQGIELEFAWYPYQNIIKARYGNRNLKAPESLQKVTFQVFDSDKRKTGAEQAAIRNLYGFASNWQLPELPEGAFQIQAELLWKNGTREKLSKTFTVKKFVWEKNDIGKTRIIIPPFVPLQVDPSKRTVKALQTGYQNGGILWKEIFALGDNILSAPVVLRINGKTDFFHETSFKFTEISQDRVKTETAFSGKGLDLALNCEYDYDGMCRVDFTFIPTFEFHAGSAVLEIPMRKQYAYLFHSVQDMMRFNPSGKIPEGTGIVWKSSDGRLNPKISGNFRPYVWFGEIYRGIAWFSPSDKHWSLNSEKAALELERQEEATVLKIHLVNHPIVWQQPFSISMGFQPTPVKPQPMQKQALAERWKPAPHILNMATLAGSACWGTRQEHDPFPAGHDYSMIQQLSLENRRKSGEDTTDILEFVKKHLSEDTEQRQIRLKNHLERGRAYGRTADLLIPYMNPNAGDNRWEEYQVFQDEWYYSEFRETIDYDEYFIQPVPSYQDMFLHYVRELLRNGMDGVYYDNVRDRLSFDPFMGPAWTLPSGKTQPFFNIFEYRDFIKRTAVLLTEENKMLMGRPCLVGHMTNTNIIPLLSFMTVALDLELEFGSKEFQDRFREDMLLTQSIGTQSGCIPEILASISGNQVPWVTRTFMAMTLAYDLPYVMWCTPPDKVFSEIRQKLYQFGYGSPAVDVFPCWDNRQPVETNRDDIKITTFINKGKKQAMIAVSEYGGNSAEVTLNLAGLDFASPSVFDVESSENIHVQQALVRIFLPRHDFRLLSITSLK